MLKRGLGRSSIVAGILGEYDKAGLEKAAEIMNSYDSKIADVEKEISGLEYEKKKASTNSTLRMQRRFLTESPSLRRKD